MNCLLAYMLFLANTNPGAERQAFYAMKGKILRREDIQELVYDCWNCNGAGGWVELVPDGYSDWIECHKCGGDGVWDRRWVILDRWELGGRTFHNPNGRLTSRPAHVAIRGRVRHPDMGRWATVAKWALFCWFYPSLVRHAVGDRLRHEARRYEWWKNDVMRWRDQKGYALNYDQIPF